MDFGFQQGVEPSDGLAEEARTHVAHEVGPIARPEKVELGAALPKTRSGKIVRRVPRSRAPGIDEGA